MGWRGGGADEGKAWQRERGEKNYTAFWDDITVM